MATRVPASPPLKSWRLRRFKSAMDVELDFAPLTLIAGQNSSGKSTICSRSCSSRRRRGRTPPMRRSR